MIATSTRYRRPIRRSARAASSRSSTRKAGRGLPFGPMSAESQRLRAGLAVPVVEVDARDPAAERDELVEHPARRDRGVRGRLGEGDLAAAVAPLDDPAGLGEPDLAAWPWPSAAVASRSCAGGWRRCSCAGPSSAARPARRGGTPSPSAAMFGMSSTSAREDRARSGTRGAACAVVGGDELRAVAGRLAAVVGLVPGRERRHPRVARAEAPELVRAALGRGQRAPRPGCASGRTMTSGATPGRAGGGQPAVQRRASARRWSARPSATAQRARADAAVAEARVAEHVGLLVGDADRQRARRRRRRAAASSTASGAARRRHRCVRHPPGARSSIRTVSSCE